MSPTPSIYTTIFVEVADFIHSIDEKNKTDVTSEDMCLITPFAFIGRSAENYKKSKKYLEKNYNLYNRKFPSFEQCAEFNTLVHQKMKVAKATVISMHDFDVHDLMRHTEMLKIIRENKIYIILAGKELCDFDFHKEALKKDMDENIIFEIEKFFDEFRTRIISLPHALFASEINQDITSFNFIPYSIPGVNYVPRNNFKRKVCGVNTTSFWCSLLYQLSIKIMRRLPFSRLRICLMKNIMYLYIKHSKFSFTCGATDGCFVRKFLEIPAAATVLICPSYMFLQRLGIHKYLNYIPFDPIEENLEDLKPRLQKHSQVNFAEIIKNTQRLLQNKHSISARRKQLEKALFQIEKNDFIGSFWEDGEFIIKTNNDPK